MQQKSKNHDRTNATICLWLWQKLELSDWLDQKESIWSWDKTEEGKTRPKDTLKTISLLVSISKASVGDRETQSFQ